MASKKTIGVFHYQVGGTDGVSLEIDKWKLILEGMGHTVHLIGGDLGTAEGTLVREMYHHLPESKRLNRNTFQELVDFDPAGYQAELERMTAEIAERFREVTRDKGIDLILAENVWCVGANPAVAPALEIVRQELELPAVAHNHDFYWERREGFSLTCAGAVALADLYLPPHDPAIRHTVINSLAQSQLLARKGIPSTVVPNVFDFAGPAWVKDPYNEDLREEIGLTPNDLVLLQATRIVSRKGIELAIDFASALNDPERRKFLQEKGLYDGRSFGESDRIVLVLAGYARDDATGKYKDLLTEKARQSNVPLLYIEDRVDAERGQREGKKVYSLWDTYTMADLVTYPSLWEGWGNQFLEGVKARLPLLVFEYPVYLADIKDKGFQVISLGDQLQGYDSRGLAVVAEDVIERAADQALIMLTDPRERARVVERNFTLGRKHYSLEALRGYLERVFNF